MANESLLATLNQALNDYVTERGRMFGRIQGSREALFDAEAHLKRAQQAERQAIFGDDEASRKARELLDHYNSLPPPRPQALLEQQNVLSQKQLETHRLRMRSHEPVQEMTRTVEERKTALAVAEQDLKNIDTRITETNAEIARLRS